LNTFPYLEANLHIQISPVLSHEEKYLCMQFPYKQTIINQVRKLPYVTWIKSFHGWQMPNTTPYRNLLESMFKRLGSIIWIGKEKVRDTYPYWNIFMPYISTLNAAVRLLNQSKWIGQEKCWKVSISMELSRKIVGTPSQPESSSTETYLVDIPYRPSLKERELKTDIKKTYVSYESGWFIVVILYKKYIVAQEKLLIRAFWYPHFSASPLIGNEWNHQSLKRIFTIEEHQELFLKISQLLQELAQSPIDIIRIIRILALRKAAAHRFQILGMNYTINNKPQKWN